MGDYHRLRCADSQGQFAEFHWPSFRFTAMCSDYIRKTASSSIIVYVVWFLFLVTFLHWCTWCAEWPKWPLCVQQWLKANAWAAIKDGAYMKVQFSIVWLKVLEKASKWTLSWHVLSNKCRTLQAVGLWKRNFTWWAEQIMIGEKKSNPALSKAALFSHFNVNTL